MSAKMPTTGRTVILIPIMTKEATPAIARVEGPRRLDVIAR